MWLLPNYLEAMTEQGYTFEVLPWQVFGQLRKPTLGSVSFTWLGWCILWHSDFLRIA
jgi:hypothetical protein